jgi:NAD(P)-dependent dehydrogenase (short-subunit alcohol dehydrogenase family)
MNCIMKAWDLTGKTALVTGGSRGIGRAIVAEFLALGADVLFTARGSDEVSALEEWISIYWLRLSYAEHSFLF